MAHKDSFAERHVVPFLWVSYRLWITKILRAYWITSPARIRKARARRKEAQDA